MGVCVTALANRLDCFARQISDRQARSVVVCHTVTRGHKAAEPAVLLSIDATVLACKQRCAEPLTNGRYFQDKSAQSTIDRNGTGLQSCTMSEKLSA